MELLTVQHSEIKQEADMESKYQILAEALLLACPEGFSKGELVAKMDSGFSNVRYNCHIDGEHKVGLDGDKVNDFKVDDALHEIRTQMTVPGQKPWSKCTFTLFPDGKFKFDVDYDD
jgi:hypothetical protein